MRRASRPIAATIRRFGADRSGTVAVEYAILGSMAVVIAVGFGVYTGALADIFNSFAGYFK